jgi:hypothetical protein
MDTSVSRQSQEDKGLRLVGKGYGKVGGTKYLVTYRRDHRRMLGSMGSTLLALEASRREGEE